MNKLIPFILLLSGLAHATANFGGYQPYGDIHWKQPVASVGTLPTTGNVTGDTRLETTTFTINTWNGAAWVNPGGGGTGTVTNVSGTPPITVSNPTSTPVIACNVASGSQPGCLSSSDWTNFNSKIGAFSIGALDAQAENANGLALVGSVLSSQSADSTHPGMVNNTAQTISGAKTFTGVMSAPSGSVSAVGFHLSTDVGTGFYRIGVDQLNIASAGSIVANIGTSGLTMSLPINMGSNKITSVTDPTLAQDAATKSYVDSQLAQLNPAAAVVAASIANVNGTYSNAVSGICIGDTFTTTATTAFALDGVSPSLNQRVLLKDQTSSFQSGVWTLTTQAVGGVSGAILTRALDFDSSVDINAGQIIPVSGGTVNAGSSWYQTAVNTTCNTSTQTWTEFQKASSAYASSTLTDTHIYVGNSSAVATDVALSQDCSLANTGAITCTKTNNVSFATSATTDTTNASNISSGTLSVNRFNSGTGASSSTYLSGSGTWTTPAGSSPSFTASTITTNTTLAIGTAYSCDSSSGNVLMTLPDATASSGRMLPIVRKDGTISTKCTINSAGTDTFNPTGVSSIDLTQQNVNVILIPFGTQWMIFGTSM